jgi:hypothetical protein
MFSLYGSSTVSYFLREIDLVEIHAKLQKKLKYFQNSKWKWPHIPVTAIEIELTLLECWSLKLACIESLLNGCRLSLTR